MSSVAEKARMMNGWMMIRVEMNIRFRLWGSCCRWPWLAIIMRGRNQQESTKRGVEIWSMPVQRVRVFVG